jgi:hypothetical protein
MKKEKTVTSRRRLLKGTVAAALTAPLLNSIEAAPKRKAATSRPRFFTPAEFAMVEELTEIIIPADEHSPGAKAAKCAAYLDFRLSEAFSNETRREWREGLRHVNRLAKEMHSQNFMQCSSEQREAVVARMAANEASPQQPEEKFFVALKQRTANAYYTSRIGLHDDLKYKGNTSLREFAGVDLE